MEEDSPFLESQYYSLQRLLITACNSLKHCTLGLHFKCNLILKKKEQQPEPASVELWTLHLLHVNLCSHHCVMATLGTVVCNFLFQKL